MLGTIADLLGNANGSTPVLLLLGGAALLIAAWIGGRVFRSLQRQGARIGTAEKVLKSERTRRRQLEQVLREAGIRLPYWPDDPAELHGITATVEALRDAEAEIAHLRSSWTPPGDEPAPGPQTDIRPYGIPPLPPRDLESAARHRRGAP